MSDSRNKTGGRGHPLEAKFHTEPGKPALARALPFVLAAMLLSPCPAPADSPSQVFQIASPSIVVIGVFDTTGKASGLGSGVAIGPEKVVTNCHVTKGSKTYKVEWRGQTHTASLTYADYDRDLCQLNVPGLKAPMATTGSVKTLKVGSRVYAIGAPQGLELSLSEGLVSSLRAIEGSSYIQTTAAISPGSSGGGLFDENARLIGITTFYLEGGQSLNFALPVDWIAELPKRAKQAREPGKGISPPVWSQNAIALEEKMDWERLLEHSQKWVRAYPRDNAAWCVLGQAYHNLNQYSKAIEASQEAIRLKPDDPRCQ